MKYISLILLCIFFSCQNEHVFRRECEYYRDGKIQEVFSKRDTIKYTDSTLIYSSKLEGEFSTHGKWILPSSDEKQRKVLNNNTASYLVKNKEFVIDGKIFHVTKYFVDNVMSADEESNKFYCKEFGIIIETFWPKNYIKTVKIEGVENPILNQLISKIMEDEAFMWHQNELKNSH